MIFIKIRTNLNLVLNIVLIPRCHVNAVQDDISAKTVPIRLRHTVGLQLGLLSEGDGLQGQGDGLV